MKIYLMRHGEALSPEVNAERPLSPRGREEIERVAKFLGRKAFPLSKIFSSPKKRAVQTAEIMRDFLAPGLGVEEANFLLEEDAREAAMHLGEEDVMVVGHIPLLNELVSYLVVGDERRQVIQFSQGMVVCLSGSWRIEWAIHPELI